MKEQPLSRGRVPGALQALAKPVAPRRSPINDRKAALKEPNFVDITADIDVATAIADQRAEMLEVDRRRAVDQVAVRHAKGPARTRPPSMG